MRLHPFEKSLLAVAAFLAIVGVANEIGHYVAATHRQMCVSPSALPWLWCHR